MLMDSSKQVYQLHSIYHKITPTKRGRGTGPRSDGVIIKAITCEGVRVIFAASVPLVLREEFLDYIESIKAGIF